MNTPLAHNPVGETSGPVIFITTAGRIGVLNATIVANQAPAQGAAIIASGGTVGITNTIMSGCYIGVSRITGAVRQDSTPTTRSRTRRTAAWSAEATARPAPRCSAIRLPTIIGYGVSGGAPASPSLGYRPLVGLRRPGLSLMRII